MTMRNDTKLFDSPVDFRPERWLKENQQSNRGYRRRVCLGRFIAINTVPIAIARLLRTFDIKSKDGKRLLVDGNLRQVLYPPQNRSKLCLSQRAGSETNCRNSV